ncbi:MAG: flagellar hook-length control protein FliK, partial [Nitrospinae bacterium]|nr:flagellar hook-length control protein FliK [Nitrospinota bacterium]
YVDPEGGGGNVRDKKAGETAVVFMLEMTLLGPVRVDTRVAKEQIAGSVYVGSDPVAAYLEGRLPDLVAPLKEAGYQVTFDVRVASPATLTEELASFVPLTPNGLINLKA